MKVVLKILLNLDAIRYLDTFHADDTKLSISVVGFRGLSEPYDPRSFLGHKFTQALPSNLSSTQLLVSQGIRFWQGGQLFCGWGRVM